MEDNFCPLMPIRIGCPIHGQFMLTPLMHLVGYGCPICDAEDPDSLNEKLHNAFEKLMSK